MQLDSSSFTDGQAIPADFAFGTIDPLNHVALSNNRNPAISWRELPEGTRSLVLICHDPDVPTVGDDVNQEGRTVSASLARCDFFHWVLVDISPDSQGIQAGQYSQAVTAGGKAGPDNGDGTRSGVNNYTDWFAGEAEMQGDYYGYDGPCPPWNDELLHHYVFTLYALDVARCPVEGRFGGPEVREAIAAHILAEASIIGSYTLNPAVDG